MSTESTRGGFRELRGVAGAIGVVLAAALLVAQDSRWRQATPDRPITLPADHASHPEYGIEWWYYSGNLDSRDGRRFGYQLTFFRVGVQPHPTNASRWSVRDLFVAHFALTDVSHQRFRFAERMNRDGPGWAGPATDRYDVWNEDWIASQVGNGSYHLRAGDAQIAIDLDLHESRSAVLHGDKGYSQKGSQP